MFRWDRCFISSCLHVNFNHGGIFYAKKEKKLVELLKKIPDKINEINNGNKKEVIKKTYEELDRFSEIAIKEKLVTHQYTVRLAVDELENLYKEDKNLSEKLQWVLLYILFKTNKEGYSNMLKFLFENMNNQQKLVESDDNDESKDKLELFGNVYKII